MNRIKKIVQFFFDYANNWLSIFGTIITSVSAVGILTFLILDLLGFLPSHTYIYVVLFLIMPGFFLTGLLLIPLGMLYQKKFRPPVIPGGERTFSFPKLDFNEPKTRIRALVIAVLTLVNIFLLSSVSYQALQWSSSNQFCGTSCHLVMEPEHVAHQNTPHSRIKCTDCHVGPGVKSYIHTKLKGMQQLYGVIFNSYPKPVPTPIHMRPAQETCGHCHWSGKQHEARFRTIHRYAQDKASSKRSIRLIMKTGAYIAGGKQKRGIHWHIQNPVWYISDPKREKIPWVRVKWNGKFVDFKSKDSKLSEEDIQKASKRQMDCIDCHNRSAHAVPMPDRLLDKAISTRQLSRNLPFIKKKSLELLTKVYPSRQSAKEAIAGLEQFYQKEYPKVSKEHEKEIKTAQKTLYTIYQRTQYPFMKVDWNTYPDHIGHRDFPGCMRCHDGKHVTKEGKILNSDCNACHTMPDHTDISNIYPKQHQVDCVKCHDVFASRKADFRDLRPSRDQCLTCHKEIKKSFAKAKETHASLKWKHECTTCHSVHGQLNLTKPQALCANCHDNVTQANQHKLHLKNGLDCVRCHTKHAWHVEKDKVKKVCSECHVKQRDIEDFGSFKGTTVLPETKKTKTDIVRPRPSPSKRRKP